MSSLPVEEELLAEAARVRERAYAPYSRFHVGSAIRVKGGEIYVGVNVENCSYPLSVCAERNAIAAAVADGAQPGDVVAIAIATHAHAPTLPCGACRQVLAEFALPDTPVFARNLADGNTVSFLLEELLPNAFGPDDLREP
jgi:cytidine deaminase